MLRLLRLDLLARVAKHLDANKVLVGDCSTQLAMHCLTLITRGRGAAITALTDFACEQDGVSFLKPFRFVAAKEIALYNFSNSIRVQGRVAPTTQTAFNVSFERLTEHFIAGLEVQ